MWRSRWASSSPRGVLPGFVAANVKGPPATLQTHRVRMNFRPGSLSSEFVDQSSSAGLFDPWPTAGFAITASLKWSITAAIANTPPNRSYKLGSAMLVPSPSFHVPWEPPRIRWVYGRHLGAVHARATRDRSRSLRPEHLREGREARASIGRYGLDACDPEIQSSFTESVWLRIL